MATRNDLSNYSGCSFEDLVDLVLKLQEVQQELEEKLESSNCRVDELLEQICDLQDLAYP